MTKTKPAFRKGIAGIGVCPSCERGDHEHCVVNTSNARYFEGARFVDVRCTCWVSDDLGEQHRGWGDEESMRVLRARDQVDAQAAPMDAHISRRRLTSSARAIQQGPRSTR